jgi:hypothetical protein
MWAAMKAAKQIISRSIIGRNKAALFRVISLDRVLAVERRRFAIDARIAAAPLAA